MAQIELGNIALNKKLGILTIKTPSGQDVTFEITGDNKTVDLSSYATQQGSFMGNWNSYSSIPSSVSGFTSEGYDPPTNNSFLIVQNDETHGNQISKYRYIEDGEYSKDNWDYEFGIETNIQLNEDQTNALNSGITSEILSDIQNRLEGVENFQQDDIVQPIVTAVSEETHERNTQISGIQQQISAINQTLGQLGSLAGYNIQLMSQEEYNSLESHDSKTLYFITDPIEEYEDSDEPIDEET